MSDRLKDLAILLWLISDVLGELDGVNDSGQQQSAKGDNEGVDCNTVVFVLFVGVRTPQAEAGQQSSEEIKEEANHNQSCSSSDISNTPGFRASNLLWDVERKW